MSDYTDEVDLLSELDTISKLHVIDRDQIDAMMIEFSTRILATLKLERMNVWLFNADRSAIISIGEYDMRTRKFQKESVLEASRFPKYFEALEKNKIIFAENIYKHPDTQEFKESYSKPNDIITLLDIPLRLEGKLIGVMCYEKTGAVPRVFSEAEKSFAFSVALVFTSNLEARHRRVAQKKLEQLLKEKELLISEINHRVRNNFSILVSLIRISKRQKRSQDALNLMNEYEQRIFAMMKIHDLLMNSKAYKRINLGEYLTELIREFKLSHPELAGKISANILQDEIAIDSKSVVYLGLITTEIFLNSIKYSLKQGANYFLKFNLSETENGNYEFEIADSGSGFDFEKKCQGETTGLALIKDLADELNYTKHFPTTGSPNYVFVLTKD